MSQEKPQVTGRINTSCDRRSIISLTEGFFPLKERIFLATGNSFPLTGIKECLVSQYIFPVNGRIFLVTGNKFHVTGRKRHDLPIFLGGMPISVRYSVCFTSSHGKPNLNLILPYFCTTLDTICFTFCVRQQSIHLY